MAKKKLSQKQRIFVKEYLANKFNATQAAIAAGYSEKTAKSQASRLLTNVNVQKEISLTIKKTLNNTDELSIQILQALKDIAFSNIGDLMEWQCDGSIELVPSDSLPREVSSTISEISNKPYFDKHGNISGYGIKVKQVDKLKALDLLARFVQLYEVGKDDNDPEDQDPVTTLTKKERTEKLLEIQKRLGAIKNDTTNREADK